MRGNTEKGFVKLLTTCVIVLLVLVLVIVAGGFFLFKKGLPSLSQSLSQLTNKSTIQEKLSEKANTNRVTGDAGETFPYGDIKEETVVTDWIGKDGGVLTAYLSNNVRAYVIVPPGYVGVDGEIYKLTPYFSMPTSKNAPALPTDLGYGFDFEIENVSGDTIEPLYIVFDLDQGKTIAQIAEDPKLKPYCLPTLSTFNPAGCALLNNVPLSSHTNTKYAVVSPIRDAEHNDLLFMNSTVPIGFDNLIVAQVTSQATFIPVTLSKDVLTDLVRADKPGFSMPLIEAMVHAVTNDIFYDDPETYYHLNKAFFSAGDPFDSVKALQILPKYKDYLTKLRAQVGKYANAQIAQDTAENYIDLQLGDYGALEKDTKDALLATLTANSEISSGDAYTTLTSIFQVRRLEKEKFAQAKATRNQMVEKIVEDINYYIDPDIEPDLNSYLMFESALWGKPEYFTSTRLPGENYLSFADILTFYALAAGDGLLPPDAPQAWQDLVDKLLKQVEAALKAPCGLSMGGIFRAMRLAQLIGREDLAGQLMDIVRQKLLDDMKQKAEPQQCAQAQAVGLYADYSCVQDFCDRESEKVRTKLICTTLMDKNLKNFGMNEVDCTKVPLSGGGKGPARLPADCGGKTPPLCTSSE